MVTHDQDETFAFADRNAVLRAGRALQFDTVSGLHHPTTRFVGPFVGEGTFIEGIVADHTTTAEHDELPMYTGRARLHTTARTCAFTTDASA